MRCPLDVGYLTVGYRPITNRNHFAVDIGWTSRGIKDPDVFSWNDGVVVESTFDTRLGGGNVIAIKHYANEREHYITRYVHLKERKLDVGQMVRSGQVIGIGGNTGISSGPHLHFEIWRCPNSFKYVTLVPSQRALYAINPLDNANWLGINGNNKGVPLVYGVDTSLLPTARTNSTILHMRALPNPNSPSLGFMPSKLPCLAETTRANGFEWVVMNYEGKTVYSATNWVDVNGGTQIIEIVKPLPIDETITNDDYTINIKATPIEKGK